MNTELELITTDAPELIKAVSTTEAQAIVEEFQTMLQRARAWIIKKTEAM